MTVMVLHYRLSPGELQVLATMQTWAGPPFGAGDIPDFGGSGGGETVRVTTRSLAVGVPSLPRGRD